MPRDQVGTSRYTSEEKRKLEAVAVLEGLTVSAFIRRATLREAAERLSHAASGVPADSRG